MSQENVEIARAMLEAWNAGDMDAWADCCEAHLACRRAWP
jgi:ketosteroid isomerase-like protein